MEAYIDAIGEFIRNNEFWAGPIIGLLTLAESMLILGFFVPATALLLMIGGLVGNGLLNPVSVLGWGIGGAIVGDALSYWIGRWAGPSLMHRWPMNKHKRSVARARLFFSRYGFLSILIGRFLGPIRSTIPTVAGIMRMPQVSFQLANVLSAIAWVPMLMAPGYLAVRSFDAAQGSQQTALLVGTGLSVVFAVGIAVFMLRKRKPATQPGRIRSDGR